MRSNIAQRRLTQHKRFVPYGTHPNPVLIFEGAKLVEGLNHKRASDEAIFIYPVRECLALQGGDG
jgi:hypothetical protein